MNVLLWLRDKKENPGRVRDYNVSDLVYKSEWILAEHGFVRRTRGFDEKRKQNFFAYEGLEGSAMMRFVDNESDLIALTEENGELIAMCPVYIDLKNVPQKLADSIDYDLLMI